MFDDFKIVDNFGTQEEDIANVGKIDEIAELSKQGYVFLKEKKLPRR